MDQFPASGKLLCRNQTSFYMILCSYVHTGKCKHVIVKFIIHKLNGSETLESRDPPLKSEKIRKHITISPSNSSKNAHFFSIRNKKILLCRHEHMNMHVHKRILANKFFLPKFSSLQGSIGLFLGGSDPIFASRLVRQ